MELLFSKLALAPEMAKLGISAPAGIKERQNYLKQSMQSSVKPELFADSGFLYIQH